MAFFDRQSIIDGLVSSSSEANGWHAERPNIPLATVIRTSSTVVTITLPALADYDIASNEIVTPTASADNLTGGIALASSTFSLLAESAPVMPADTARNTTEPGQNFGTFAASNTPDPAAVYTVTGTDAGVLGIDENTGEVTANSPTDLGTKLTYTYTVTATNSVNADSQNIVTTIIELGESTTATLHIGIGIGV